MSRESFTQSSDPYCTEQTHEFLIENNSLTNHFPGPLKEKYVPVAILAQNNVYLNPLTSSQGSMCPGKEKNIKRQYGKQSLSDKNIYTKT